MSDIDTIKARVESIRDKAMHHKGVREERSSLIERLGLTEKDWLGFETADEISGYLQKHGKPANREGEVLEDSKAEIKE